MATHIVETSSISHMRILDGLTGVEEINGDIYGVNSGTLTADFGSLEQTWEDGVTVPYVWFNSATLSIEGGFIPFSFIELITGTPIIDYASMTDYADDIPVDRDDPDYASRIVEVQALETHVFTQQWWSEAAMNYPPKPVIIRRASQDSDHALRLLDFMLYRVYFAPPHLVSNESGGYKVNLNARVVMSDKDERGVPFGFHLDGRPVKHVGKLVNLPAR